MKYLGGADQKERGLWRREWLFSHATWLPRNTSTPLIQVVSRLIYAELKIVYCKTRVQAVAYHMAQLKLMV